MHGNILPIISIIKADGRRIPPVRSPAFDRADHGQNLRGAYHKLQRPVFCVAVYHFVPLVLQRTFPGWFGYMLASLLALIVDTYEKLYYKQQAEKQALFVI